MTTVPDFSPIVILLRERTLSLCCPRMWHLVASCRSGDLLKPEFMIFLPSENQGLVPPLNYLKNSFLVQRVQDSFHELLPCLPRLHPRY